MGESERYIEYRHLKKNRPFSLGSDSNAVVALIIMNLVFFMLLLLFQVIYHFYHETTATYYQDLVSWFVLPDHWSALAHKPWALISQMFTDTGDHLFRLVSNMVWLYFWGRILQKQSGSERVFPVYFYGGLVSGIFFCTTGLINIFPSDFPLPHDLFGANPAVMAVAVAATIVAKNQRVLTHIGRGIPLVVLLILYIVIDIVGVSHLPWIYAVVHLVGGLTGAGFAWLLLKGKDTGLWMSLLYHKLSNLFTPPAAAQSEALRNKIFYNTHDKEPFTKKTLINQQRIDQILDKIHSKGMASLTEEERDILNQASNEKES